MKLAPTTEPFDPHITAEALAGTWSYPAKHEPEGIGYVHYTKDGKTFCPVHDPSRPGKLIPGRFWSFVESASTIRTQPFKSKGWDVNYCLDGTTLRTFLNTLTPTHDLTCQRVSEEEVPEWFRDALAQALARPWPLPEAPSS